MQRSVCLTEVNERKKSSFLPHSLCRLHCSELVIRREKRGNECLAASGESKTGNTFLKECDVVVKAFADGKVCNYQELSNR